MPFIAEHEDERVIPEGVEDGQDVFCTHCSGTMRPRGPMKDGRARHFFHIGNIGKAGGGSGCSGGGVGESDVHRKYKSFAVSRLKELYSGFVDFCRPEQRLSTVLGDEFEELPSGKDDRQADAMMLLEDPTKTFGRGLIVEVQYRNLGKDIEATTQDYLANGFSVLWVDEDDFETDRCLLTKKQIRMNTISVWPNAVPSYAKWGGLNKDEKYVLTKGLEDHVLTETKLVKGERGDLHVEFIPNSRVPATLPNEFFDVISQDVKRMYDWDDLFKPPDDYSPPWGYSKVPATLPPEWHGLKARELWESTPWMARFRASADASFDSQWAKAITFPFQSFVVDSEGSQYEAMLRRVHYKALLETSNDVVSAICQNCDCANMITVIGGVNSGMCVYSRLDECEYCEEEAWMTASRV